MFKKWYIIALLGMVVVGVFSLLGAELYMYRYAATSAEGGAALSIIIFVIAAGVIFSVLAHQLYLKEQEEQDA